MKYFELDTPSMLVNKERMLENLKTMQDFADKAEVSSNSWEYFHMTVTLIGPRIRMNA